MAHPARSKSASKRFVEAWRVTSATAQCIIPSGPRWLQKCSMKSGTKVHSDTCALTQVGTTGDFESCCLSTSIGRSTHSSMENSATQVGRKMVRGIDMQIDI